MMLAALTFPGSAWAWAALAAAVVLVPLAWWSLAPAGSHSRTLAVGLALRTLGIGLLVVSLLDPQWTAPKAVRGANLFAVVADNSEGLNVTDPGAEATRAALLQDGLAKGNETWLAQIADEFQLRSYVFDRSIQRVRDFGRLDFTGDQSNLGTALERLRERYAGQPLAGVLLFTDGNATDLDASSLDLRGLPPVHPVILGSDAIRDLRIADISVRQTAFDDAPVSLRVDVAGAGLGTNEYTVSVRPLGEAAATMAETTPEPARVRISDNDRPASTTFTWRPAGTGIQVYEIETGPADGRTIEEATPLNNRRLVMLDRGRPAQRILYVGGRPGWEFKFLNRALAEDPQLQMVGLLRVARREPKFEFKGRAGESSNPMFRGFEADAGEAPRYDQPVLVRVNARDEEELRGGFPDTAAELFAYDAVILDDVEAGFFTTDQLAILRRFVADRGGGLLVLGGADSLDNGGFAGSPLAAALPVYLDRRNRESPEGALHWALTREGWVEPWTRVNASEPDERERIQELPPLMVAHGLAQTKPGATVLATVEDEEGTSFPALIAQPYGAGRAACLTAGDLWRWALARDAEEAGLDRLWRQISRWLVTDVPAQVTISTEETQGAGTKLNVLVLDKDYRPLDFAQVRVTIRRLEGSYPQTNDTDSAGFTEVAIPAEPVADAPGRFAVTFSGRDAGAYLATAEATALGGEVVGSAATGWTIDPAAEEFRSLQPNRALLAEIARQTGGSVLDWADLEKFANELPTMPAPIEEMASQPVWHNAWVFLVALGCFASEWLWRRWRGLP
ncbi:MAG: glutamine amidotransferase [Opitutaceae bacterium]